MFLFYFKNYFIFEFLVNILKKVSHNPLYLPILIKANISLENKYIQIDPSKKFHFNSYTKIKLTPNEKHPL